MTARAVFVRITFWSSLIAMVSGRVVVSTTEAQTRRMIVADTGNVLIPVITVAGEQSSVHMLTAVRFPPPALFFANPNKNWTIGDFEKPKQSTSYAVTDDMSDQDQFSEEEKLPEEDPLPEINKRPEQSTLSINNQPSDKDERPEKGPLPEKNQPSEQDKQPEQNKLSEKDQATEKVQPLEKEPEREKLSDKDQKPEKNQLPVKDQPSKQVEQPEHSKVSEKDQPSEKEPEQDKLSDKDQRPEKGPGQDSLSEKDQIPETGQPPDQSKVSEKNQPSEKKQEQEKPSDTDQRPEKGPFPEEQDNLPEVSVQDEVQLETTVTTAGPGAEEKRKTEAEKGDGLQQTTGVREREETTTVDSRNEHTSDRRPSLADLLHSATGGGGWFGKRQTFPGDRRPSARPAAADTGRPQQQQQTIILTSRPLPWPTADVDYLLVKRHG